MLGIIDWGIGGIGIYKELKEKFGGVPVVYFSDTGATPYGKMSRLELVSRLDLVIEFLKTQGVTHLVIGCNAASTAIPYLKPHGIKIDGVIDRAVAATTRLKPARLGLIGGRRTVLSGVYRHAFKQHGIAAKQRIAQPLSGLIESGDVSSEGLKLECMRILKPLKNCSHILMACTHYPAIASVMANFVSGNTVFIDPASEIVRKIRRVTLSAGGGDKFVTSGDPREMKKAAWTAFGVKIDGIEKRKI